MADEKTRAMIAIKNEFMDLNKNPLANIGTTVGLVNKNNLFEWTATMLGPTDTSYSSGLFILRIKFPNNYPQARPEVCFSTPIYHINVKAKKALNNKDEPLGHVCISTLNWWKPTNKIREVLTDIIEIYMRKKLNILLKNMLILKSVKRFILMIGISLIIKNKHSIY